jgi:translation initiation factor 4G
MHSKFGNMPPLGDPSANGKSSNNAYTNGTPKHHLANNGTSNNIDHHVSSNAAPNQNKAARNKSPNNAANVGGVVSSGNGTPINNILQKEQIIIKQASSEKADKKGKKDKGPNKEEFMKKMTVFVNEIFVSNLERQVELVKTDAKEKEQQGMDNDGDNVVVEVVDSEKHTNGDAQEHENADVETEEKLMNDLVQEFLELKVPDKFMKDSIIKILNEILDKSDPMHTKTIEFLQRLRKENKLTNNVMLESFKNVVLGMNEKEKTIPKVTSIVASLLTKAVTVKLCKMSDVSNFTDNGQHYPLFLIVLQQLHKTLGKEKLQELFKQSKVNLMTSLPECDRTKDRMAEILDDRSLSFLYPLLRVQAELWKQIQIDSNPTQFYKWIKDNVDPSSFTDPGFITAVVTVLLKYITQVSILWVREANRFFKPNIILFSRNGPNAATKSKRSKKRWTR